MPNIKPPVRSLEDAVEYKKRIESCMTNESSFKALMTIYLTDTTTPEDIKRSYDSGVVVAAKLYPAGATTNSEFGVTAIEKIYPALNEMASIGMPLLVHGEVVDPGIDVFDRSLEKPFDYLPNISETSHFTP